MQVPRASLPLLFVLINLLLCSACGDDPPSGPPLIEIGTGALDFEQITDGQELGIVAGVQGGYHFVVNARMRNLLAGDAAMPNAIGNPQTRFSIFLEDGRRVDNMIPPYRLGYRNGPEDWYELPSGRILQLEDSLIAEEELIPEIYGQTVRLVVEVRDAQGGETKAEAWVVAVPEIPEDSSIKTALHKDSAP